ncbi:MAG TPA: hypothetical protein VI172_16105 [Candidatus Dormibacteraeota bacterium]|jgi:hypothetical protein
MIPVYVPCSTCLGNCHVAVKIANFFDTRRCARCDGLGRQWAPGAPAYGCTITLADREPGEIVTLGNGQRAKILWHMPRKRAKVVPETTFLDILDDFFESETYRPVAYPSSIGVASVDVPRAVADREAHDRDRTEDPNDPMQRRAGALL